MAGIKQIIESVTPQFTSDRWLLKHLDTYLNNTSSSHRANVFYPSSLGNTCDRFLYLAYQGKIPDQTITAQTQRIFDNGNYLENRMDEYFTALNLVIDREKVVTLDAPPMSGRVDFILKHAKYGEAALELKSINSRGFAALKQGPKPEHIIQLQIYLNLLPMEHGVLLYENKNDQTLKSFVVMQDISSWQFILDRCYKIMGLMKAPAKCTGNRWCRCKGVTE